jgi:hypothetical protein
MLDKSRGREANRLGLDFVADARVSTLKGKCDDNKELYWLIQFVTVPDTNRLTVNSKGQELKLLF